MENTATAQDTGRRDLFEAVWILLIMAAFHALRMRLGGSDLLGVAALFTCVGVSWVFLRRRGEGWRFVGLRRPASWPKAVATAFVVAAVLEAVALGILYLTNQVPDVSKFDYLRGNLVALVLTILTVWVTAALVEELIFRGFLLNRFARAFGGDGRGWVTSLIITSVIFGLVHYYQGPVGIISTGIAGLALGILYLAAGRNLWVVILAHGFMDTIGLAALSFGLLGG